MGLNFANTPPAICGLALANFGMAMMIYTISERQFNSHSDAVLGLVYTFILLGLLMVIIYLIRFAVDPASYVARDFSSPAKISSVGTFAMSLCLMGRAIRINELEFPASMCASIVYIGAVIQIVGMISFLISCWKTSTWAEPYWNNAIHSSLFTAVCLGGDDKAAVVCRTISIIVGLIFLIPNMSIMTVRMLIPREMKADIVANNPNVAMLQSAFSITCAGWLISPITGDAANGIGGMVGHTLFALSTFGFFCTILGIIQRWNVLYNFGEDPMWVAITFPFANTALTAGLYRRTHPTYSYVLTVWVFLLSAIAGICIISINIMYFKNYLFLFSDIVPPATKASATPIDDKECSKECSGECSGDTLNSMDPVIRIL